jgi:hypothetical protein
VHSLNLTDIHTTWVETAAVLGKSQIAGQRALEELREALPFPLIECHGECHGELEVITVIDSSTPASSTALLSHERYHEVQTGERPSLCLIGLSKSPTPLH